VRGGVMASEMQNLLKQFDKDMAEITKPAKESFDYIKSSVKIEVLKERYDPVFEGNKPQEREALTKHLAFEIARFDENKDGKMSNHEMARFNTEDAARYFDPNKDGNVTYTELERNLNSLHKSGVFTEKAHDAAIVKMLEGKISYVHDEIIPGIQDDLKKKGQPPLTEEQALAVASGAIGINDDNRVAVFQISPERVQDFNDWAQRRTDAAVVELKKKEIIYPTPIPELAKSMIEERYKAGPRPKQKPTSAVDTDTIQPPETTPKIPNATTKVASK